MTKERAILERLYPYLVKVNHIHLDDKPGSDNILYASEVWEALYGRRPNAPAHGSPSCVEDVDIF